MGERLSFTVGVRVGFLSLSLSLVSSKLLSKIHFGPLSVSSVPFGVIFLPSLGSFLPVHLSSSISPSSGSLPSSLHHWKTHTSVFFSSSSLSFTSVNSVEVPCRRSGLRSSSSVSSSSLLLLYNFLGGFLGVGVFLAGGEFRVGVARVVGTG